MSELKPRLFGHPKPIMLMDRLTRHECFKVRRLSKSSICMLIWARPA